MTTRRLTTEKAPGFEIVDNDPGIPTSEQKRVLYAFYCLPESAGEDSGLGLAITTEAAACLGGMLSLLNRPDTPVLSFTRQVFE